MTSTPTEMQERPFVCPEPHCQQRFKRKFTLKEHYKTHTGEKPFECPVKSCGKTFTTSGNLARHKRLHPWLKPLVCSVDSCGRSFATEERMEQHMKTHFKSPQVLHSCTIPGCSKQFTTTGNLTRHIKQQHFDVVQAGDLTASPQRTVQSPLTVEEMQPVGFDLAHSHAPSFDDGLVMSDEEILETLSCLFDW
ncbi:hypothetical protein Poli38472_005939 [Pythium oligandrum]|uniref:C2H2-type domain-containing protein n=1 Tax=Pythium oligandrum TaxID=41045 RepID=A0A8K1CTS7_PYTOL|nr:hypothetical protein Poli38472_005939 [Pythium oligandrum]|eukprot:TMW68471.1 hypothetical protein Poli38472_005939 [Pythium oligandrum]